MIKLLDLLAEIGVDLSNYKGQVLKGDVVRAPKNFPLGGEKLDKSLSLKVTKISREGVNRYKLSLEDTKTGKKYTIRNFQMDGEYQGKKLPKWGLVRKSKENVSEANKRIPRKPGQPAGSSKHSDLYTDEDPKGTITGLGFKDASTARQGITKINKAKTTHAHKVQATLVMKQRAKVAMERTKDPEKKKKLRAAYQIWSKKLEQLKAKTKRMKK